MKKIIGISLIRMLCTLMVVALHISQVMEKEAAGLHILTDWLNLGLVMFFGISAFLYSRKEIKAVSRWYLHRYIEIAVPSLIVGLGTILVFALRGGITLARIGGTLLACLGLEVYISDSWMFAQLWFLTYILFFYLTVPLIQKIDCRKASEAKFWGIFAAAVVILQVVAAAAKRVLGIETLSVGILLRLYLPYFVFRRYDINGKAIKPILYFFTAVSAVGVGVTCFLRYSPVELLPGAVAELIFIYTQSVAGFVLFCWLYKAFCSMKDSSLLRLSDRYSYEVYLTHCLFIGYSTSIIERCGNRLLGIVAALLLTAAASAAVHWLSQQVKGVCNRWLLPVAARQEERE